MPVTFVRPICLGVAGATILLVAAPPVLAQEGCTAIEPGNDLMTRRPPFVYVVNPHFFCEGNVEIWGDSAVVNQDQQWFQLIGSARYRDGDRELTAREARYFNEVARLQAQGNVYVTNYQDGSTVENGDLVYLRQTDTRSIEEMTFTTGADGLRPRATVYPRRPEPEPVDTATAPAPGEPATDAPVSLDEPAPVEPAPEEPARPEEPAEPEEYVVVGDSLFFRGDSYFDATGNVEIVRDSLFAFADYAEYEGEVGELVLDGSNGAARVLSSSYELVGRTITLASAADGSDEVRAAENAFLTGEDLTVTAPRIVLHLLEGELERMVAVPLPGESDVSADTTATAPVRPLAVSEGIELTGDSLDLAAPGGTLERIFAAGNARSVSHGRSELNVEALPELARQDWIDADTIEVFLVPVSPDRALADGTDAESEYEVDHIVAKVRARSLYRLVPSDSSAVVGVDPPAVSYQMADQITIFMVDGQADRVESVGQVSGWHLEPLARSPEAPAEDAAPADSTAAPPDNPGTPEPSPIAGDGGDASPPAPYLLHRR